MALSVFVSSTMRDLTAHRAAVQRALLDAGLHPVGMEHFVARPEEPTAASLAAVQEADVFVGIYAWRYGFIPDGATTSITEQEFDEAQKLGKPCFCFVVDEASPWPEESRERGESAGRLQELRSRLNARLVCATFTTPDDLAARVLASLQRHERVFRQPARRAFAADPESRNLQVLRERVAQFYIAGVLDKIVGGLFALTLEHVEGAVEPSWGAAVNVVAKFDHPVVPQGSIMDLFENSGRLLLITGASGSGKTVSLLRLVQELIAQAREDANEPVPVVFNLGTWSARRPLLRTWLVAEARRRYYVAGVLFTKWLREHRVIVLLDGLDEVVRQDQDACVRAINDFVAEVGVPGIAVCARREEYLSLPTRLKLNAAVSLEPLAADQVDAILASSERPAEDLRNALERDPQLAELATSPLMLNLMQATDSRLATNVAAKADSATSSPAVAVLERYVEGQLTAAAYAPPRDRMLLDRLAWLAHRMRERGESAFHVDALQPSYLSATARISYWLVSRIALGFVLGLSEEIYLSLLRGAGIPVTSPVSSGLATGLVFGTGLGIIDAIWHDRLQHETERLRPWSRVALKVALLLALFAFADWIVPGFSSGGSAYFGVAWSLAGVRARWQGRDQDIRVAESLVWSWQGATKGLLLGAIVGLALGVLLLVIAPTGRGYSVLYLLRWFAIEVIFFGPLGAVLMGWRAAAIAARVQPNQGIRLSVRSFLRGGLVLGGIAGFLMILTFMMFAITGPAGTWDRKLILTSLWWGVNVGACAALLGALWYGGIDVINHYVLRTLLWMTRQTPRRLIYFLEGAVGLRLLRRIGGGYAFIHRMLLDYLADHRPSARSPG